MRKIPLLLVSMMTCAVLGAPRVVALPLENEGLPQDAWYLMGLTESLAWRLNESNSAVGLEWRTMHQALQVLQMGRQRNFSEGDLDRILVYLKPDYYLRGSYLIEQPENPLGDVRYSVEVACLTYPADRELFNIRFTGVDLFAIEVEIYKEVRLAIGEPLTEEESKEAENLITDDAVAYRWYCRAVSTVANPAQQADYLIEAIKLNRGFLAARRELARAYLQSGDTPRALKEILTVLREEPDDYWALKYYGDILDALGEGGKAIRIYRRAGMADEREWRLHLELAWTLEEKGSYTLAEKSYDKLLVKDSRFYDAYRGLAVILLSRGEYTEALDLLERARSLGEGIAEYHNLLGRTYIYNGRFEDAIRELQTSADLAPRNGKYAYDLGFAYYRAGDTRMADEWWRTASLLGYSHETELE
ncbi:MAG TPA: tetratricopeptide repeat protein [bacterium]|nr:tetratricopeptide repeat protein [bacterium]